MDVFTIRRLRQMLYELDDQNMTVRDLRSALFQFDDQEALVDQYVMFAINRKPKTQEA